MLGIGQIYIFGGGYYWDGEDVWEDIDGDGIPDCICIEPPVIEGEAGNGSGGNPDTPPTDPFDGIGGGSADSGGGGDGNSNPDDEISDAEAYELGYYYLEKINDDILNDNYTECGFDLGTLTYYSTPFSYGLNVQGLWASWLPLIDQSKLITGFGRGLSFAGFVFGVPQLVNTIVVVANGDSKNLTEGEIMSSVSTALSAIGFVAAWLGVISNPVGAAVGFTAAIIGVASMFVNDNYYQYPRVLELDNGLVITILTA